MIDDEKIILAHSVDLNSLLFLQDFCAEILENLLPFESIHGPMEGESLQIAHVAVLLSDGSLNACQLGELSLPPPSPLEASVWLGARRQVHRDPQPVELPTFVALRRSASRLTDALK